MLDSAVIENKRKKEWSIVWLLTLFGFFLNQSSVMLGLKHVGCGFPPASFVVSLVGEK
ncbi:hypothetical protein [Atopococcus tabaci]|uniref:hypothetical protein n=1 Tax=Atopococcus tabaci TaxID=269774 RepID=UPI002408F932|nr:hypothetical protein [Atopococcus tabaci]